MRGPIILFVPPLYTPPMSCDRQPFPAPFPIEIEEHILDQLVGNSTALRRCSLTCRAWVPRSRFHLFGAIRIATKAALDAVVDYFQEHPRMRILVRSLIVDPVAPTERIRLLGTYPALLFQILPNLRRWEMRAPGETEADAPRVSFHRTTLIQLRYSPVTELHVSSMRFTSRGEFVRLISSFPRLRVLQYSDVTFGPTNGNPVTVASPLHPRRPLGLSALHVLHWKDNDYLLSWLLEASQSSLQALVLRRRKSVKWQSATMPLMSQLCSLTLHVEQRSEDGIDTLHLEAFGDALHCMQALRYGTTLKQLEIHLHLCNPSRGSRNEAPCNDPVSLALFLSEDRMRNCCQMLEQALLAEHPIHLTIVMHLPSFWTHRELVLRALKDDTFPNLHSKGLLNVGYSGGNACESCTFHAGPVSALAVSPDARWIASASSHLGILWDARSRRPMREWLHPQPGRSANMTMAFSPDSNRLACCGHMHGRTPFVQVLSADKGSRTVLLEGPALDDSDADPISQLACMWLPDKLIFICLTRSTISIRTWDPQTFEPQSTWQDMSTINHGSLLLSRDGRRLAVSAIYDLLETAASSHLSVPNIPLCVLWDCETSSPHEVLHARSDQGKVLAASFGPEGERLVLSLSDHTVWIWNVTTRELVLSIAEPIPLEFDPRYHLYRPISAPGTSSGFYGSTAKAVAFSPDGRYLLSLRYMHVSEERVETLVMLWDTWRGRLLRRWDDTRPYASVPRNSGLAAFSPCGTYAAFTANDGRVHVVDWSRGGLRVRTDWGSLDSEDASVQVGLLPTRDAAVSLVFSPDGQTLCWGTRGGGVEVRSF